MRGARSGRPRRRHGRACRPRLAAPPTAAPPRPLADLLVLLSGVREEQRLAVPLFAEVADHLLGIDCDQEFGESLSALDVYLDARKLGRVHWHYVIDIQQHLVALDLD